MMKVLKVAEGEQYAPSPREFSLISLYPERDPNFFEVNTFTATTAAAMTMKKNMIQERIMQQELPSQLFLPACTSDEDFPISIEQKVYQNTITNNNNGHMKDRRILDIDIQSVISTSDHIGEDGTDDEASLDSPEEVIYESFTLTTQLQQLLPSSGSLKSSKGDTATGALNTVTKLMIRPGSGRVSELFLQGRSIFQSPVKKLSHPFEYPAQYSPKLMSSGTTTTTTFLRHKNSFELIH